MDIRNDILDWHGNHLHTNFHIMFNILRDVGYYIETLGLVDLEDEYFTEEIEKPRDDVVNTRLGLVVFAEWYNIDSMVKMRFFDDKQGSGGTQSLEVLTFLHLMIFFGSIWDCFWR